MIILAVTVIVLLFGGPVVLYNRLIRARNLVNEGWSGIDVQLKRRHDLVPNLVETVKGYASHEKGVLEDVTRLRAELNGGAPETGENETRLSHSIKTLFAVAESYPELKAEKTFGNSRSSSQRLKTSSSSPGGTTTAPCATTTYR
jgi:LemA protein